jgi:hypothetical protein
MPHCWIPQHQLLYALFTVLVDNSKSKLYEFLSPGVQVLHLNEGIRIQLKKGERKQKLDLSF